MMKKGPLALPQDDKVFIQIAFVFQVDGMEKITGGEGGIRTTIPCDIPAFQASALGQLCDLSERAVL